MERRRLLAGLAALGGAWALGPLALACGDSKSAQGKELRASVPRAPIDDPARQAAGQLAAANAGFGWDLYRLLAKDDGGNLFFSPYSVASAMAMVYAGASGDTRTQLARALRWDTLGSVDAGFNVIDQALQASGPTSGDATPFTLTLANSAWTQTGHPFRQEYLETLARYYGAGVRLADFQAAAEDARQAVNRWVADQTANRIKDLLPAGSVSSLTRLVLANAIYFKGDWETPFAKSDTGPGQFTVASGQSKQATMMRHTGTFAYAAAGDVEALELPYAGNNVSMVVLLPAAGALAALEARLEAAIAAVLPALQPRQVRLTMPRWEFSSSFDLKAALAQLGAVDLFDADRADLSGMDGARDLYVSGVFHKAFVRVDEKGTEAAAATGVVVGTTAAPVSQVEFTLDRPFLFLIRERTTGAVLFAGRVLDPTA